MKCSKCLDDLVSDICKDMRIAGVGWWEVSVPKREAVLNRVASLLPSIPEAVTVTYYGSKCLKHYIDSVV